MKVCDIKKCDFNVLKCVTSGNGFREGCYYSSCGWNNGVQVQRVNEQGDCETMICIDGGIGKGDINNPDNTGCPSFVDCEEVIITYPEEE